MRSWLPGIDEEEKIIVSPFFNLIFLCVPFAILASDDKGSPCVPVVRITMFSSFIFWYSSALTNIPLGGIKYFNELATLMLFSILLPNITTFLLQLLAASNIWPILTVFDAKVAIIILPLIYENWFFKLALTLFSDIGCLFDKALVLSDNRSKIPSLL